MPYFLVSSCKSSTNLDKDDCLLDWTPNGGKLTFKTGRKDCTPETIEGFEDRNFLTSKKEVQLKTHGNGQETVDFFKQNFGLTAEESIALLGGIFESLIRL